MVFSEWVDGEVTRSGKGRTAVLRALAKKAGVAFSTLNPLYRSGTLGTVYTARKIAAATGGKVRVRELLGLQEDE